MICLTIVGIVCLSLGMYAGKRRAKGAGWYLIACEFSKGALELSVRTWKFITLPFRKEGADEVSGEAGPE